MKKKTLIIRVLSLFMVIILGSLFYSCNEADGERCLDCSTLVKENVGFDKVKLKVYQAVPNSKDFRSYYNGEFYFTSIMGTDTINYFVVASDTITLNTDDSYSFTVNIYTTTNVLLENKYTGKQHYYEVKVLALNTDNADIDGWEFNPLTSTTGNSVGKTSGGITPIRKETPSK